MTSLGDSVQSLEIRCPSETDSSDQGNSNLQYLNEIEKKDEATKIASLKGMFPSTKDFAVVYTLRKCGGRFDRALDELLNQAFFTESELADGNDTVRAKGIDAFTESNVARRRGRKKAGKNRSKPTVEEDERRTSSLPASPTTFENPWIAGRRSIEFISSRANTPYDKVSSLFHQHGASVPETILSLLDPQPRQKDQNHEADELDPTVVVSATELGNDFPSIPPSLCIALIKLSHPSTSSAHELAKALTAKSQPQISRGGLNPWPIRPQCILPSNSRIPSQGGTRPTNHPAVPSTAQVIRNSTSQSSCDDPTANDPAALASNFSIAQSRAYEQASAAARRGRSDRLMISVAGYYSQLGRDYVAKRVMATAEAADALVESQSTPEIVDLHGVNVKDGTRIARAKVQHWWKTKERRAMGYDGRVRIENGGVAGGLQIVTGVGKHSKDRRAMLGPAVGRLLASEGWDARVDSGVWTVTDKRR